MRLSASRRSRKPGLRRATRLGSRASSSIRTLAGPLRYEPPKVKGSRFIASVTPAETAGEARAFVDARREEFRDATHNCFAWRLPGGEERSSDDGEPSGTAGRPILRELEARSLVAAVVVVTRYFGGTKLGTGGLVRAYGGAASAALDRAEVIERRLTKTLCLRHAYELTAAVASVLGAFGLEPVDARYGASVEMAVAVPIDVLERFRRELVEATAGRIEIFGGEGRGEPGP